jgi:DinB superfamily
MEVRPASTANPEQIELLRGELRRSCHRFVAVLADVPEALRDVRESDGGWSIMDCAEHVCLAEELMSVSLRKRRQTDAAPDLNKDAVIRNVALDRSRKISAPPLARPAGRYHSLKDAADAFRTFRERNITFIESLGEDLRRSTCLHPLGIFDSYQFIQIMALHPERHASQIEEIKNTTAYREALVAKPLR